MEDSAGLDTLFVCRPKVVEKSFRTIDERGGGPQRVFVMSCAMGLSA